MTGELPGARAHLDAFRAGDRRALAAVYRCYAPQIETLLVHGFTFKSGADRRRVRGLRNPADVEDCLHDTFVKAFAPTARAAYDGLSPYAPYLRTIARNTVLSRLRGARVEDSIDTDDPADAARLDQLLAAADATLDDPWEHAEIVRVAQAFLDGLGDVDRAILERRFQRREPQAAVATALGLSAPTLRKRERRIFRGFFAHMRRHGYLEHHAERSDLRTRRVAIVLLALQAALRWAP